MAEAASFVSGGMKGALWAVLMTVGVEAVAQDRPSAPDPLDGLAACSDIVEATARLTCFDREFALIAEARDDKKIAVVSRDEVRQARRAVFGLSLPRLDLFERADGEEVESFTGKVRDVEALRDGRYAIQIDDTVWHTTQTGYFQRPPKVGLDATVKRGLLGSYELSIDGKNALKAVRVR